VRASDNRGFDGVPDLALALSDVDHRINDEAVLCKQFGDELPATALASSVLSDQHNKRVAGRHGFGCGALCSGMCVEALVETMNKAIVRLRNGGVQPVYLTVVDFVHDGVSDTEIVGFIPV